MSAPSVKIKPFLVAATFVAIITVAVGAKAQLKQENEPQLTTPLEPLRPGVTKNQIFAELIAHNELRNLLN